MRNIYLIIKYEIQTTLSKRSYWIMTFIFPAFVLLLSLSTQVIANSSLSKSNKIIPEAATSGTVGQAIGYVDQANLIQRLPADVPQGLLKSFPDQASAQAALESGQIKEYILLPADYLQNRKLIDVQRDLQPLGTTQENLFQYLITYNLTENTDLTTVLVSPLRTLRVHNLGPQATENSASPLSQIVPYATLFIFFLLLTNSSGLMLQSVSREKENRMAEILLVSMNPRDLMTGKIAGLAFLAILQLGIWLGGVLLFLNKGQQLLGAVANYQLPPGFLLYSIAFFGFGYLVYASLMGMAGVLAPTAREGGQLVILVMLPLMLPLFFNFAFTQAPDSLLPVVLSLFPLSAPSAMITRLAVSSVPFGQLAVSLGLLAVTAYFIVTLSARFFRADNLLSSAAFKWDRLFRQLKSSQ